MDIKSFQKKLGELVELAKYNNRTLNAELVEQFFGACGLEENQIKSIYVYLKSQGIHVKGGTRESESDYDMMPAQIDEKTEADPLSVEEEEYLKNYVEGVKAGFVSKVEREELFQKAMDGDAAARQRLVEGYLPEVIRAVRSLHRKEIFAGDMLQEGNIGLLSALETLNAAENPHEWILESINKEIKQFLHMYQEQCREDDYLINRVEKLEAAVRDLTDGAEDKFSVEELSVFLDMSVEEIKDVLRLTGDDK
ncbi:sigma factor [Novisyntrophococcus fermenticellae]|uniref:sigma factor n=1 Tax=Novisyntrophococcus fermenticellae TaxID=2068655 RepID=UPI001E63F59B|nr:sigma factor [Novisyntrophococcus fermenticellae]